MFPPLKTLAEKVSNDERIRHRIFKKPVLSLTEEVVQRGRSERRGEAYRGPVALSDAKGEWYAGPLSDAITRCIARATGPRLAAHSARLRAGFFNILLGNRSLFTESVGISL